MTLPPTTATDIRAGRTVVHRAGTPTARGGMRRRQRVADAVAPTFLTLMALLWVIPVVWVLMESFNQNTLPYTTTFFPTRYTFDNYVQLFTDRSVMNFGAMFLRTLVIAIFVCLINLFFVLSVGFVMSRLRFTMRRSLMNTALILGMFPGIMAVVAIYFILKALGLTGSTTATVVALIVVYSAGSGAGRSSLHQASCSWRRPSRTLCASGSPWSAKKGKGAVEAHSWPIQSSGSCGAKSKSAVSARSSGGEAIRVSGSPWGRLPAWSWLSR